MWMWAPLDLGWCSSTQIWLFRWFAKRCTEYVSLRSLLLPHTSLLLGGFCFSARRWVMERCAGWDDGGGGWRGDGDGGSGQVDAICRRWGRCFRCCIAVANVSTARWTIAFSALTKFALLRCIVIIIAIIIESAAQPTVLHRWVNHARKNERGKTQKKDGWLGAFCVWVNMGWWCEVGGLWGAFYKWIKSGCWCGYLIKVSALNARCFWYMTKTNVWVCVFLGGFLEDVDDLS